MQSGSPKKPSPGPEHSGPVQSTSINTVSYNNNARSTAAVKLRTVVASAPSEEQPKENGAAAAAGSSEQEVVDPLQQSTQVRLEVPDDEEIDGKRIVSTADSRSHPEVSTSTVIGPTLSTASYTTLGQKQSYADPRETGHTDEQLAQQQGKRKGLSTIPNQFCTILDAVELKKLLLLSSGSRGGIVPSSSAVMDMYMVGKVVGVGSYGKVRAAWHRLTESKVAIKTYDKSKMKDPAHWKRVHSEIKIMEQMTHPRYLYILYHTIPHILYHSHTVPHTLYLSYTISHAVTVSKYAHRSFGLEDWKELSQQLTKIRANVASCVGAINKSKAPTML
jgi:hypothetical protein